MIIVWIIVAVLVFDALVVAAGYHAETIHRRNARRGGGRR